MVVQLRFIQRKKINVLASLTKEEEKNVLASLTKEQMFLLA